MSDFARLVSKGLIVPEKPKIAYVVSPALSEKSIADKQTSRNWHINVSRKIREHKPAMTCRIRNGSRSCSSISYEFAEYGGYDRLVGYHQSLRG